MEIEAVNLKNILLMTKQMQEEQFKKHALWIAHMKQSNMIVKVKQLDYGLNMRAG